MQEKLGMGLEDEVGEGETELEDEEGKGEDEDLIIFEEEGSEEDLTSEQEVAEVEDDEEEEEDLMSTYIPHPIPFFLSSQKHPTNFFLLGFDY